ncbi:MAG: glutamate racemase [Candidatus Bruticola sp.]
MKDSNRLIGIFDSGVGGLTVAEQIDKGLPNVPFIFFGDTKHVPYGNRSAAEVVSLIDSVCHHLIDSGAQALVMACNTSSALAFDHVASWSPAPVIGIIEEAAKAAVQTTRNGAIGVMANALTAASGAYEKACAQAWASLTDHKFSVASEVRVFPIGCPKLVPLIERGEINGTEARQSVREYLEPLLCSGIDTLILGCTHYPFVRPLIEELGGADLKIIDPAFFVVKRLRELGFGSAVDGPVPAKKAARLYQASGSAADFAEVGSRLLGHIISPVEKVELS